MPEKFHWTATVLAGLLAAGAALAASHAAACPFCSAVRPTLCDDIDAAAVAVIAEYRHAGVEELNPSDPDAAKAEFLIVRALRGRDLLGQTRTFKTLYFGNVEPGSKFLALGNNPPNLSWATPMALSPRSWEYLRQLRELPREGPERLAFVLDYLEDPEEMLRLDAYDEFARASFAVLRQLAPQLKPNELISRIRKPDADPQRLRLYLTLLSVCGGPEQIPVLEQIMRSGTPQSINALDALSASYLRLKGPAGLPLIVQLFLTSESLDNAPKANAVINALRFHGQEPDVIPRQQIVEVMRSLLDRPQLAGRILADLARWEDWSVIDRVADLFVKAEGDTRWVRDPVVGYLQACPLPAAKQQLDRLALIDPDVVKRGSSLFPPQDSTVYLGGGPSTAKSGGTTGATPTGTQATSSTGVSDVGPRRTPGPESPHSVAAAASPRPDGRESASGGSEGRLWRVGLPVAAAVAIVVLLGVILARRRGRA